MIDGLIFTKLKIIEVQGGNVLHGMKRTDSGYLGFGEAYFSSVEPRAIKAWKRHRMMTMNIVVPIGSVRFVVYDNRKDAKGVFEEIVINQKNYGRLTIPPMVWTGFQGMDSKTSILLNIANIPHDPYESDHKSIDTIEFDWSV